MNVLVFAAALKVLTIGNSFSVQMVKAMPPIAQDMGLELDICSLYIGGCSFERHWKNVCDPTNKPYSVTRNTNGKRCKGFAGNIPEMLKADKWDVVTIQQGSHESWKAESYHPYGDNLVKTIRELAPQAKIVVHETWSYTPWDGRLKKWGIDQNEMYEKLHAAYGDFAKPYGFEVIPLAQGAAGQVRGGFLRRRRRRQCEVHEGRGDGQGHAQGGCLPHERLR